MVFINQIVINQCLRQLTASVNLNLTRELLLEIGNIFNV